MLTDPTTHAAPAAGPPDGSSRYQTENVIVVVIDGLRNLEAFEDPEHRYIPHIWNDLRPIGAIATEYYVSTRPVSTQAHNTLVTGIRQISSLAKQHTDVYQRSYWPTMFEAYRLAHNRPPVDAWVITGNEHLGVIDGSLHPSSLLDAWATTLFTRSDRHTINTFYDVAGQYQPSLVFINLKDVDRIGHAKNGETFEDYLDAIMAADALVYELWQYLQNDPNYGDRTTLIVTSDHGRDKDDYRFHGKADHMQRHVPFLAVGPDIQADLDITHRRLLIDLAPTVGELLRFKMPFAQGTPMLEMLMPPMGSVQVTGPMAHEDPNDSLLLTETESPSIRPSIDVSAQGVMVTWTERDVSQPVERYAIRYCTSADFGQTWSEPMLLTDSFTYYGRDGVPTGEGTPLYSQVIIDQSGLATVGFNGYAAPLGDDGTELFWGVNVAEQQSGNEWTFRGFENLHALVPRPPAMTLSSEDQVWLVWAEGSVMMGIGTTDDRGDELKRTLYLPFDVYGHEWNWPVPNPLHFRNPSATWTEDRLNIAMEYLPHDRDGQAMSLALDGYTPESIVPSRLDRAPSATAQARITSTPDGVLHATWSELQSSGWQVYYGQSTDGGHSWSTPATLSLAGHHAWSPDIATDGSRLAVVWEDWLTGRPQLCVRISDDGGVSWQPTETITSARARPAFVDLVGRDGRFYLVWQDARSGNWQIHFRSL
ncbi:MAG: sulfatase-like hydrolase/transferase [Planctomycetes bacterium]|nr:sulfatase-like hydrolase/transferase [Planctomycetota bacterium]